jgi:hypothetical protein
MTLAVAVKDRRSASTGLIEMRPTQMAFLRIQGRQMKDGQKAAVQIVVERR